MRLDCGLAYSGAFAAREKGWVRLHLAIGWWVVDRSLRMACDYLLQVEWRGPKLGPMEENRILTRIFHGLERPGPGEDAFTRKILSLLPQFPRHVRIADIGCGAGAATLLLAEYYRVPVMAIDIARPLLNQLENTAKERGLSRFIQTQEADMGNLKWPNNSIDLFF